MPKNKGNYYKRRTKKWFDDEGYYTEYTEVIERRFDPLTNSLGYKKRDILEADGISLNGTEIIFWNSILGKSGISSHYKRFKKIPFPRDCDAIKVWIVVWTKGAREPEIVEVI